MSKIAPKQTEIQQELKIRSAAVLLGTLRVFLQRTSFIFNSSNMNKIQPRSSITDEFSIIFQTKKKKETMENNSW